MGLSASLWTPGGGRVDASACGAGSQTAAGPRRARWAMALRDRASFSAGDWKRTLYLS